MQAFRVWARPWCLVASLALVLLPSGGARAMARIAPPETQLGDLRVPEGIVVHRQDLSLDCHLGPEDAPVCALVAEVQLGNPTAAAIQGAAGLPVGDSITDARLSLDGAQLPASASTDEPQPGPPDSGATVRAFMLSIDAGGRRKLTLVATLVGRRTEGHLGLTPSPVHGRHVLLHTPSLRRRLSLVIHGTPEAIRAPDFVGTVKLRAPSGWDVGAAESWSLRDGAHTYEGAGVQTTLTLPQFPIRNGGVLLGLGGALGDEGGFRMRLGWEVAAPSWLLYQVTAETDLQGRWTVTPLVLAATPSIFFIIPSLGFGLGMPIAVRPTNRFAVRLQAEAMFLPVGFVASCDVWPGTSREPSYTQWTLLGQIAL